MASDLNWFIKRLSAMDSKEISWRIGQSLRYKQESVRFKKSRKVTDKLFNKKYSRLQAEPKRLGLNLCNEFYTLGTSIPLLGNFKYEDYKKDWFQGFGGEGTSSWPMIPSSKLNYRERNDIGDARMNWELNKHFQFAILAKNYYATLDSAYLDELATLFNDWNDKNPFLWGISWVSTIEIAERSMNWCYMYVFLEAALHKEPQKESHKDSDNNSSGSNNSSFSTNNEFSIPSEDAVKIQTLLNSIRIGILNMADYISHHYSQFSSANNHLIVEISAVLHAGILFDYKPWVELAESILTREIFLQNFSDGINKEQSQYYQTFEMEVLALDLRLMKLNGIEPSKSWDKLLKSMARYISNNIGNHDEVISFGDDDDGRIIDFHGGCNHFKYTLELMGLILDERYTELTLPNTKKAKSDVDILDKKSETKYYQTPYEVKKDSVASYYTDNKNMFSSAISETVLWLFSKEDIEKSQSKTYYRRKESIVRPEGGMTIFNNDDYLAESESYSRNDSKSQVSDSYSKIDSEPQASDFYSKNDSESQTSDSKADKKTSKASNIPHILIGIDHAPLGYGSIAAHAHADGLSFQMFADGTRIFADPGTYIYHCDTESRNDFRRTDRHNTVCINDADQSEMLGPFLWGRKATCTLNGFSYSDEVDELTASHDGYVPITHTRKFTFKKKEGILLIEDWLTKDGAAFIPDENHKAVFNLLLGENATLEESSDNTSKNALTYNFSSSKKGTLNRNLNVTIEFISGFGEIAKAEKYISAEYGVKKLAPGIEAPMVSDHAITKISIVRK